MATFTNQATLSYNGNVVNSNIVTGELQEVLSANKTALTDTYRVGEPQTFAISLINSGAAPFNDVTATDDLGAYTFGTPARTVVPLDYVTGTVRYFIDGVLQPTPTVTAENPLTVTGITVPAEGNALILYEAIPNQYAPLGPGGAVTNTVNVDGTGFTAFAAEGTVTADPGVDLAITKALDPVVVSENAPLTYTFTVQDRGSTPAEAGDNLVVSDTFNPRLTGITVTLDGTPLVEGTDYTYDETTGTFATTAGRITVPGATFTQDPNTGAYITTPGASTLTVTGTVV